MNAHRFSSTAALLLSLSCGEATEPPPVAFPVASLSGTYRVTFTAGGWGPGCDVVSLDMEALSWLPVDCANPAVVPDFNPTAVFSRNDSLFLRVTKAYSPLGDPRDIAMGYFNTRGSTDVIYAKWSGMMCHPIAQSEFCSRETGSAVLRRP